MLAAVQGVQGIERSQQGRFAALAYHNGPDDGIAELGQRVRDCIAQEGRCNHVPALVAELHLLHLRIGHWRARRRDRQGGAR